MCTLLTQNICLMCHTQELDLDNNEIGDAGLQALADALGKGALASLEKLYLYSNAIGDDGMSALASACASGALASLVELIVDDGPLGVDHPKLAFQPS